MTEFLMAKKSDVENLGKADIGLSQVVNALQVINGGNVPRVVRDVIANRPAADGTQGLYIAQDEKRIYADFGSWNEIGTAAANVTKANVGLAKVLNKAQLAKDGSEAATGNLPMGGFKITGLADPTAAGDAVTRRILGSSSAGEGAGLIRYENDLTAQQAFPAIPVDNLKALVDSTFLQIDGLQAQLRAFYANTDTGGGHFYWDANRAKADANGGTIIDPDNTGDWDGTQADYEASFVPAQGTGSGEGCWVFVEEAPVLVAREAQEYTIGDRVIDNTSIYLKDNEILDGKGTKLVHRARNAGGQPRLFMIQDTEDAILEGYKVDGEGEVGMAVSMSGVVRWVRVKSMRLSNHHSFAIAFSDTEEDPALSRFEDSIVEEILVDGSVNNVDGTGGGGIFFPRSTKQVDGEGVPASGRIILSKSIYDVTGGSKDIADHFSQALKLQNMDGVAVLPLILRGGQLQALTISTGFRNAAFSAIIASRANRGPHLANSKGGPDIGVGDVKNIYKGAVFYTRDEVEGADGWGYRISGDPKNVYLNYYALEGRFHIDALTDDDDLDDLTLGIGQLWDGVFRTELDGHTPGDITGLRILGQTFRDTQAGTAFYDEVWKISQSRFDRQLFINTSATTQMRLQGSGNIIDEVSAKDCNQGDSSLGSAVHNEGEDNAYRLIRAYGANNKLRYYVRTNSDAPPIIGHVMGTPLDANGFTFSGMTRVATSLYTPPVMSKAFDLDGAADEELVFFATKPMYLIGVQYNYGEATSAGDDGIELDVVERAGGADTTLFTGITREGSTADQIDDFPNDAEPDFFDTDKGYTCAKRDIAAGSKIVVKSPGGKAGDGTAHAILHLVERLDG